MYIFIRYICIYLIYIYIYSYVHNISISIYIYMYIYIYDLFVSKCRSRGNVQRRFASKTGFTLVENKAILNSRRPGPAQQRKNEK